ncbi:hypothetical protein LINPERPRIM_LOCUS21852, partial [Linum perenne]
MCLLCLQNRHFLIMPQLQSRVEHGGGELLFVILVSYRMIGCHLHILCQEVPHLEVLS